MAKLIFDIETIGEDFDEMDEITQHMLTRWIEHATNNDAEYQAALADIKNGLGFSPLTGQIVAIGVLDSEKDQGCVYFQAPGEEQVDFQEKNMKFKPMSEKAMLEKFWELAKNYDQFVSFNGRSFDVPFLIVRSAVNGIKPSKDLMGDRYLKFSNSKSCHIDLFDQLSFYGAVRKTGSLHLWCRAFGITSPKAGGVTGDDVAMLFKEKRFKDIARYNVGDLIATKELCEHWEKYIKA